MGLIRGGLLVLSIILLFVSLFAGNIFITLSYSITPESIKKEIIANPDEITKSFGGENVSKEVDSIYPAMKSYCQNNTEYVFSLEGHTVDIPCSTVLEGKEAIIEEGVDDIIEETYYTEHECESFWTCVSDFNNPLFLFSEESKDYWQKMFYYSLFISLVLIVLMFFLVEQKSSLPIIVGSLLIVSSLPLIKIESLFSLFGESFEKIFSIFFSESTNVFFINLVIGIVIIALGVGMKSFNIGMSIFKKFDAKSKKRKNSDKE
tara:strand:- start:165 stop:950 length:786 start_codon:yes stop_codon:yes gene_type:complete